MLKKFGDFNPIAIINPVDVDIAATKKSLKAVIESVKNNNVSEKAIEKDAEKEEVK